MYDARLTGLFEAIKLLTQYQIQILILVWYLKGSIQAIRPIDFF